MFLKVANTGLITQFLHGCVDEIIGRPHNSFGCGDMGWTIDEYNQARSVIQNLFRTNILRNKEFELNIFNVPDNMKALIEDCYTIRKDDLLQMAVKEKLTSVGLPLVQNIDWKLKWINGSSKLVSICEAALQVDLHCLDNESKRLINFEITLHQLDNLIYELEKVQLELKE